jgi:hypothetical protein
MENGKFIPVIQSQERIGVTRQHLYSIHRAYPEKGLLKSLGKRTFVDMAVLESLMSVTPVKPLLPSFQNFS